MSSTLLNVPRSADAFNGALGTSFADVTGDGKADAIIVNTDKIIVRRSTGSSFGTPFSLVENWSTAPYYGAL